ncbi:MAG: nicotinamide-nucleotide adenylyltransferase [Candidatus Altiarchaeota archaeon]|nr:nicotinamide-nucleotide adenylyltransferase [Candidatus Altiarchaeota archaeon]
MTVGLLIGRYQPFHLGHLGVVKKILEECDQLIIGIGSAQYSHTGENPFTAGERLTMISEALNEEKIPMHKYLIIPIPDIHNNSVWVSHVASICPEFDVVYTRNPLATRLFKEAGYKVRQQPLFDRVKYSGTEIRKRMLQGLGWEGLIPPAVVKVIRKFGGIERLKSVVGDD